MAGNPKTEALRRNIAFIQENIATGGLYNVASHLLQLNLITEQNYRDSLALYGRGPDYQAAMLMTSVEVRIRDNPDVYFPRFIEALRRSHLGNVADRLVQALPEDQRHSKSYDMITSNIPSPSGSTQTTATSHNQFSSFSNQPSSRYPMPPNILPYNPFPPYFLPVQQPVLPQSYLSSYPNMLQQGCDPTLAHAPSDFSFPLPTNPVHLNQQYSVLPSHTNTPILHQSPSLSYEPHSPPPLTDRSLPPQHPRLDSPQLTGFTPTSTAVAYHSLDPPTPATTIVSSILLKTTATSQRVSYTYSPTTTSRICSPTSHSPLSHHSTCCAPSPLPTTAISAVTVHSPAPPSPSATTLSAISASSYQYSLSPNMQQYVTYLKNFYGQKTPVYDMEATFINIALLKKSKVSTEIDKKEMIMDRLHGHVDVIQKKKTKVRMFDVCKSQDGRLARCVLVEGAPGVGKTTFAFELCKRWARGEILQEWPVVVIIKLRDHRTRTAQNMYDLLYHPRPEVQKAVADELIDRDGKGMLLILDGYDELTDSQRDFNSVIQCLMCREFLCRSTLMVTSRPLATRTLHDNFVQSIDQHLEVLGFTEKNIEEYIQSACGDKPELVEDFKSYLSSHLFSSALMFNPLQCAIVTGLYRSHWERGDKGFAPKTLTELYTDLLHILLLRHLTQHHKYNVQKLTDLSDLPEEVSQQLKAVTELAAEGIENQQYVFDKQEDKVPSESLGLMQAEEEVISEFGTSESYSFLHLTLQEYLAAVNYSQQCSSPEQLSQLLTRDDLFPLNNFLENYGKNRKYTSSSSATHWPVVLFVAGRTKLRGVSDILATGIGFDPNREIKKIRQYLHSPEEFEDPIEYAEVNVSLLHLLYEAQSPQLIQSTLVTSRKYLSVSGSSALDWFVIGYCIANSTSKWRVEKKGNDSPKYFDQLVMGLCLGPEEFSGECKIGSLHISGHETGNWKILLQLQPYAKSVTEIKLVGHKQTVQHDSETSKRKAVVKEVSACYPMLERLTIENAESGFSTSLICFISQQNNLRTLSLKGCNLSSESVSSLIHSLQSVDNNLLELILDECIPGHTHTMLGSTFLQLKLLDNGKVSCNITGYCCDISHWLSQLYSYAQLTELILHLKRQDFTTADTLPEIQLYHQMLESLKIDSNDIPISTIQLIGSQQNHLHTLSLMRCTFSSDVTRSLIHSLQSPHCVLCKLALNRCMISTPDEAQQNTISTKNNTTLCSLVTTDSLCVLNHILSNVFFTQMAELSLSITIHDSSEAEVLTKIPISCPVLEIIKIDSSVNSSLTLSISRLIGSWQNNLHTLSLRRCYLSSDVTRSLIHSLQSPHCKLYKLVLYACTIPTTDHTQLTTAIVSSTTITHLFFIDRNIDTPSLTALASGLKHNTTIEQLAVDKSFTEDQFQFLIDGVDSSAVMKLWLPTYCKKWLSDCTFFRTNICIEWFNESIMNMLGEFSVSTLSLVQGHDEGEKLQPMDTYVISQLKQEKQELKDENKAKVMENMKRKNEQLESLLAENLFLKQCIQVQEENIAKLKEKLEGFNEQEDFIHHLKQEKQELKDEKVKVIKDMKRKNEQLESLLASLKQQEGQVVELKQKLEGFNQQKDFIHQLKQEKQELKDEKVKVMEDTKRKNEQLHSLLNEIQFLKQHTQVQEEQVAELKQKLEDFNEQERFISQLKQETQELKDEKVKLMEDMKRKNEQLESLLAENLKRQEEQVVVELKQKSEATGFKEQEEFIHQLKQEKQELKDEKVKVMEDVKRKNEQLDSLLAENRFLKQQTQVQEKQVAELKQELEDLNVQEYFISQLKQEKQELKDENKVKVMEDMKRRNEQLESLLVESLKRQEEQVVELKQKSEGFNEQKDFIHQLKQEKQELKYEKVKVMEDVKRKNEQLDRLLAKIQFLKQHTRVQEEQVTELEQKLEDFYEQEDFISQLKQEKQKLKDEKVKVMEDMKRKNEQLESLLAENLKQLEEQVAELKQKLEDFDEQEHFISQLKQEKQELKDEKFKVMEDVKRKNEQLDSLLAENRFLKQQTQVQEEQVAELKQELEVKASEMKLYMHINNLEGKSDVETLPILQSTKQEYTQMQSDFLFPISEDRHGPHVVGEKVFHINERAPQLLSWEEYGFRIRVKEDITSGACDVTVKAIVAAGQIDLPEDCELVSAVYSISLFQKLTESIAIEIEHCAKLENESQCEYLSFVISQHDGPFRLVNGGTFVPRSQYGMIFRSCFCEFAIVKGSSKLSTYRSGSKIPSCKLQAIKRKAPEQHSSQENDSLHKATSHSDTVKDDKLHSNNVLYDRETATISTVSGEQHDTERDRSPNTIYNALVFDARDGQDLMWRFMVFNNLKAVDKFIHEISYMDKWREKSRKCFVFARKYLLLDLPKEKCKDGWQILPYTSYPYKIYEQDVKSNQFAYCQLLVVCDLKGSLCSLHLEVPVKHMVTDSEGDPYAVYIVCSSSGVVQTSGNKRLSCNGGHGEPVIRELMNRVAAPCMDQWELVGVQLDIDDAQLNSIRSSCRTDQQCFKKVFDLWRRKGSPPYTWATIINVLEAPSVGEGTVAKDVLEWLNGGENSTQ